MERLFVYDAVEVVLWITENLGPEVQKAQIKIIGDQRQFMWSWKIKMILFEK